MKIITYKPKIILGITASISAYKSIELAKELEKSGFEIHVVFTKEALQFCPIEVMRTFFPNRVYQYSDYFNQQGEILHIHLAKQAKFILIAPATANIISDIATARGGTLLNDICLATPAPIVLAPAMNKEMWANILVQENIKKLRTFSEKYHIVGPGYGEQACGDIGLGRLEDIKNIVFFIEYLATDKILKNLKLIVTLGRTEEKIDPARCITNFSSGKMGFAIAIEALKMGADVHIISGKTSHNQQLPLGFPYKIKQINAYSVEQMYLATMENVELIKPDIFIGTAAVSDYRPEQYSEHKIKKDKRKNGLNIRLTKNRDIIATVAKKYPEIFMVGFAAESNNLIDYARAKLKEKNLNMVVANDIADNKSFGSDTNEVYIISSDDAAIKKITEAPKQIIAKNILFDISERLKCKFEISTNSSIVPFSADVTL